MKFNLILGVILIIISITIAVLTPFTYWWVASIIAGLIAIVLIWKGIRAPREPIQ